MRAKALGHGPIPRLASTVASHGSGAVYSRADWNAGRVLTDEERRCGMVARVADVLHENARRAALSLPQQRTGLLEAVARVQTTDAQLSEVDASGCGAFLERAPRGRWRKISRAKTLLVEDTSAPFSDPVKSYSPRVQSYGEYVRRVGKLPEGQPLLRFAMYREGYAMEAVRHRFQYEIGVLPEALFFATPPGGSFAAITQFGLAVGVTREQLLHVSRHYNVHPLLLDDRSYHTLPELAHLTEAPQAFLHRVVLRCVEGDEAAVSAQLSRLSTSGFVNYFGVEAFGVGSNTLFDLAAFRHRGDYAHAVGGYLQTLAESSPLHHQSYLSYANAEDGTAGGAVGEWLRLCERAKLPKRTRGVLNALQRYHAPQASPGLQPTEMQDVWTACDFAERSEASAAAFVWNAMASQRLLTYGARPVVGDLVRHVGAGGEVEVEEIRQESDAAKWSIEDVVLPVPRRGQLLRYPSHGVSARLFAEFSAQHHLSFLFAACPADATAAAGAPAALAKSYRPIVSRPRLLQAAVLHDPSSCAALKSDRFLLQERQPTESWSLDYARRVREPSPFNVSERFRERMQHICQHRAGQHTVMLSFILPAGSSPWVALREVFALRYGTFHDFYGLD